MVQNGMANIKMSSLIVIRVCLFCTILYIGYVVVHCITLRTAVYVLILYSIYRGCVPILDCTFIFLEIV